MANPNTPYFIDWCHHNHIPVKPNTEVFFVNETALLRPEFIINNNIFVDLIERNQITDRYKEICQEFSMSFGTIILVPFDTLPNIGSVTKEQFESKYNIRF